MNVRALAAAALLSAVPAAASANTATSQSVVSMTVQGSSCSIASNGSDPNFGTLSNPITTLELINGSVYISCGSSSPALKIAFNDAANSGTFNFTMTNSTTTTATQTYQICDQVQFTGTACPNGYEYKDTASDAHALATAGTQYYSYIAYFNSAAATLNLTSGSYYDTLTETITF